MTRLHWKKDDDVKMWFTWAGHLSMQIVNFGKNQYSLHAYSNFDDVQTLIHGHTATTLESAIEYAEHLVRSELIPNTSVNSTDKLVCFLLTNLVERTWHPANKTVLSGRSFTLTVPDIGNIYITKQPTQWLWMVTSSQYVPLTPPQRKSGVAPSLTEAKIQSVSVMVELYLRQVVTTDGDSLIQGL